MVFFFCKRACTRYPRAAHRNHKSLHPHATEKVSLISRAVYTKDLCKGYMRARGNPSMKTLSVVILYNGRSRAIDGVSFSLETQEFLRGEWAFKIFVPMKYLSLDPFMSCAFRNSCSFGCEYLSHTVELAFRSTTNLKSADICRIYCVQNIHICI